MESLIPPLRCLTTSLQNFSVLLHGTQITHSIGRMVFASTPHPFLVVELLTLLKKLAVQQLMLASLLESVFRACRIPQLPQLLEPFRMSGIPITA